MCAIAGVINLDFVPTSSVIIRKVTDKMIHRGPDGEGHFVEANVALGYRC
jgi:asparagine synthase (glutamine-hydrolysing)